MPTAFAIPTGTRPSLASPYISKRSTCHFLPQNSKPFLMSPHAPAQTRNYLLVMKIGIFFALVTGTTEDVADMIKAALGSEADDPKSIADFPAKSLLDYDALIVGAPTWNTGADEERSGTEWDEYLYNELQYVDLAGKCVGVFGCGDGVGYGANFCDAIEEMHDMFEKVGGKMVGYVSPEGYEFDESKSVRGDKFLRLAIDNVNNDDVTEERVTAWCKQVLQEAKLPVSS